MSRRLSGRVVIATHNKGKLKEMSELLAPHGVELISAGELHLPEPEETGVTFAENAFIKAHAAAMKSGLPSFADDSGLCVEALGGDPGLYSARWAGPEKDFNLAMEKVEAGLKAKGAVTPSQRRAYFISALSVVWSDGYEVAVEGRVDGILVWPPRGHAGFGYDPMFLPDGFDRTFGEMTAEEKHGLPPHGLGLSHRARAFIALEKLCLTT